MSVSKAKNATDETVINKKVIYSTEHFTEMNITKTKAKEKTFTDLILGTGENNKDTTKTKGKTTPTT